MACALRAASKGHVLGKIVGDPLQMPGFFWVRGRDILWQHDFKHAGDHPDLAALPGLLEKLGGSG